MTNIKSISFLKSHAAQIAEDLALNGSPFVITQNGEASMVIEGVKQFREKEELIAAHRQDFAALLMRRLLTRDV